MQLFMTLVCLDIMERELDCHHRWNRLNWPTGQYRAQKARVWHENSIGQMNWTFYVNYFGLICRLVARRDLPVT